MTHSTLKPYLFPKQASQLASLQHFLLSTSALMLILGNAGTGKQELLDQLIGTTQMTRRIIRLQGQPDLQPSELAKLLSLHCRIETQEDASHPSYHLLEHIASRLQECDATCTLIIDNAHNLPVATLATLSRLAIKQEGSSVYLHILLSGTPDLLEKTANLQNRTLPRLKLSPLSLEETQQYAQQFFNETTKQKKRPVPKTKIDAIYEQSGGYPMAVQHITAKLLQEKPLTAISQTPPEETPQEPKLHPEKKPRPTTTSLRQRHGVKIASLTILCVLFAGLWYKKNMTQPKIISSNTQTSHQAPWPDELTDAATLNPPKQPAETNAAHKTPRAKPIQQNAVHKPTQTKQNSRATTGFTLQLMGGRQPQKLHAFIKAHHLKETARVLKTRYKGKAWYIIAYGHYTTRSQALQAKNMLTPELQAMKPWPRALKSITP